MAHLKKQFCHFSSSNLSRRADRSKGRGRCSGRSGLHRRRKPDPNPLLDEGERLQLHVAGIDVQPHHCHAGRNSENRSVRALLGQL